MRTAWALWLALLGSMGAGGQGGCAPDVTRTALRPDTPLLRERVTVRMVPALLGPEARALRGGEVLHPGDELQITVEAERRVFVYLLDVMAGGEPILVFPRAKEIERVVPGDRLLIPPGQALRLGATLGEERLVLIASARPLDEDSLPRLLAQSDRRGAALSDDSWLRDQLRDPRLTRRQKQRLVDDLRAATHRPACARTQAELDAEGLALLCLSFSVR